MHDKIDINNLLLAVIFSALGVIRRYCFTCRGLARIPADVYSPCSRRISPFKRNAFLMGFFTPLFQPFDRNAAFLSPVAFTMMAQLSLFCVPIAALSHRHTNAGTGCFSGRHGGGPAPPVLLYRFIAPMFLIDFRCYRVRSS
jgi:hypothetical protein